MKFRSRLLAFSLALLAIGGLVFVSLPRPVASAQGKNRAPSSAPQQKKLTPMVSQATRFGATPAVRDFKPSKKYADPNEVKVGGPERPIRQIKNPPLPKGKNGVSSNYDGALQRPSANNRRATRTAPEPAGANFEGLSNADNTVAGTFRVLPPDTIGDVGPNHYVQAVNLVFRVFSKTGAPLTPPQRLSRLFTTIGGACAGIDDGDPTVNYDPLADRWVITQFASPNFPSGPFLQCVAVSQTPDPTGAYYAYEFLAPGNNLFNDYPKFGVWPDAYYQTDNQFQGNRFADAGVFAYDRRKMLAGDPTASYIYFNTAELFPGQGIGGILPSTLDNSTAPPPPGRPNTFAYFTADEFGDPQGDALRLFDFRVNFGNPSASSFTERPESPVLVAPFNPLTTPSRNDVEQPPPAAPNRYLDTIGDRIIHRLQYRNFGSAQAPIESLVVNQTVNVGTGRTVSTHQAAPRYYQLENLGTGTGFSIRNQGTFVPDGIEPTANTAANRWMGSVALDNDGNLALGYSVSSRTVFPSIRITGRLATDPANELQPEVSMIEGSGVQTSTSGRWGDYSSMNVDPVDDCTFWYTQEYYQTTSEVGWQTRIGNFKFPSCTTPAQGRVQANITNCETGAAVQGAAITIDGNLFGTTLANGSFTGILAPGTYTVTISAPTFPSATQTVTVTDGGTATVSTCLTGGAPIFYEIVARHSSKCLDVDGFSLFNGAAVQQWDCTGGANQQWQIVDVGDGYYQILARHSGKALDVSGASQENGAIVHQWEYFGGANQQWQIVDVGDGYRQILARHSGKALDVSGASQENGAIVHQWEYFGGANQQWLLRPAP